MAATTPVESNKALVRRIYEEFINEMDADRLEEIYANDIVVHNVPGEQGELTGHEALEEYFQGLRETFPDLTAQVEAMVAEADLLAVRNRYTGTHEGEFMGAPGMGETVTFEGMVFFRIEDGKIAETWGQVDTLGILNQVGIRELPSA